MARPRLTDRLSRRNTVLSAGVSPRLRYQAELAAELNGVTLARFIEMAVERAVSSTKLPRATGVPLDLQADLWQRVAWQDGHRVFEDARIRQRLSEHVDPDLRGTMATSVADEVILYDASPAERFFLRSYLIPETLSPNALAVWNAIKERCGTNAQSIVEPYIVSNWVTIDLILKKEATLRSLPAPTAKKGRN